MPDAEIKNQNRRKNILTRQLKENLETLTSRIGLVCRLLYYNKIKKRTRETLNIESCWLEIFHLLIETRKDTRFTSLRLKCRKINQVTAKCHMIFFGKTCRKKV